MSRILAIGNESSVLGQVRSALEADGHEVSVCSDPATAPAVAEQLRPAAIVLDVMLPASSGVWVPPKGGKWDVPDEGDVLGALRDNPRTKPIPVLLYSALKRPVDRIRVLRAAADDCLAKPADAEQLRSHVAELIGRGPRIEADLQGSLELFTLAEVLELLDSELKTGELSVFGETAAGMLELVEGRIGGAFFETLHGREAVLAMCTLEHGRFEFNELGADGVRSLPPGKAIGVRSVILEIEWLENELADLGSEPSPGELLRLTGKECPPIPEQMRELPFDEVLHLVEDLEGLTLGDLVDYSVAAALRLRLILAWLRSQGLLEAIEQPPPDQLAGASPPTTQLEGEVPRPAVGEPEGAGPEATTRVLVVDDSSMMRGFLTRLYQRDPRLEVVGAARDGKEALSMLSHLRPDVVSLDLFMPVLDGVATLKRIMLTQPTPTVIVTAGNPDDLSEAVESCMRFGALGFVRKPHNSPAERAEQENAILEQIHNAAGAEVTGIRMFADRGRANRIRSVPGPCRGLVVISGGVGSDRPLQRLLAEMPADLPVAVVAELSLAAGFLRAFHSLAEKSSVFSVELAEPGKELRGGVCYLAGREQKLRIGGEKSRPVLEAPGGGSLFRDAVDLFGAASMGILLSGEGEPPGQGLLEMRVASGFTLVQNPATCVHPEQTRRARELELVDVFASPAQLAGAVTRWVLSRLEQTSDASPSRGTSDLSASGGTSDLSVSGGTSRLSAPAPRN